MKMGTKGKVVEYSRLLISWIIHMGCVVFVAYQAYKCLSLYSSNPKGTSLQIQPIKKIKDAFPSITLCVNPEFGSTVSYDKDLLSDCGIKIFDQYLEDGRWTGFRGENCTNPKILFESSISQAEEWIDYVQYFYFDNHNPDLINPDNHTIWTPVDVKKYGRCFTARPTEQMLDHGIREIHFKTFTRSLVFFHQHGLFETSRIRTFVDVALTRKIDVDFVFEVFKMLDFGGDKCDKDPKYDKDSCMHRQLFNASLQSIGCTTPFGPNKTKICTDQDKGKEALTMYNNVFQAFSTNFSECTHPCTFITTQVIITNDQLQPYIDKKKNSLIKISTQENIKITEATEAYTLLSLIAEIGGYVGLFLGISIVQINNVIKKASNFLCRLDDIRTEIKI